MSADYYDKQGNPLTQEQYLELLGRIHPMYKLVGNTTIGDALVSTVWLGLDHSYDNGEPVGIRRWRKRNGDTCGSSMNCRGIREHPNR